MPGDSLFNISRRYNTDVAQLRALNGIGVGRDLAVGRSIIVPRVDESIFDTVIVGAGDSLYSISKRYNVSLSALQVLNQWAGARDLKVGEALLVPKLQETALAVHVVGLGDTLAKIAEAYGTTVSYLQSLNGIADASLIQLDDAILVPTPIASFVRPGFGVGIHVFADKNNIGELTEQVSGFGIDWVKIDVSWADLELEPGIFEYETLDAMVAAFELIDVQILLNIYGRARLEPNSLYRKAQQCHARIWRPTCRPKRFSRFLTNLVTRYAGLVDAYEIWKSPNLLKYWTVPVFHREPELTEDGDYGIPEEVSWAQAIIYRC